MRRSVSTLWPLVTVLSFAFLVACGTVEAVQEASTQTGVVETDSAALLVRAIEPAQTERAASLFAPAIPSSLLVDTPAALNVSRNLPTSASETTRREHAGYDIPGSPGPAGANHTTV